MYNLVKAWNEWMAFSDAIGSMSIRAFTLSRHSVPEKMMSFTRSSKDFASRGVCCPFFGFARRSSGVIGGVRSSPAAFRSASSHDFACLSFMIALAAWRWVGYSFRSIISSTKNLPVSGSRVQTSRRTPKEIPPAM